MAYIVPRVLISEEFSQLTVFGDAPLAALIIGPQFDLNRYNNAAEKSFTAVVNPDDEALANNYQYSADVIYAFPNKKDGTIVDKSFTKVYLEKAKVEYYPNDSASTGGGITRLAVPNLSPTKYYSNRFSATNLVFKSLNGTDRSTDFSLRDVKAGDLLDINDGVTTTSLKVKTLHASKIAAAIGSVTNDSANAATHILAIAAAPVAVGTPVATLPANTTGAYVGHKQLGIVSDVFTVEVTTTGNHTAARFKITSASGAFDAKLDQALVSDILTLDNTDTNTVRISFASSTGTLTVGDKWTLTVYAVVTRVTPTAALPYTGPNDLTYKLKVVKGGPLYNGSNADVCARIAVSSDNIDSSGIVNVQATTAFKVGSYGLTVTFAGGSSNGGLVLGDIYYVPVTAIADDKVNIIETYETLPTTLTDGTGTYSITAMSLVKDFEVKQAIVNNSVDLNWEIDEAGATITINSGIITTEENLLNGAVNLELPVLAGKIFVEHRDLVTTNSLSVSAVSTSAEVEAKFGKITVDNPIAQGVYDAVLNAAGVVVYCVALGSNDLDGYIQALNLAEQAQTYYGVVPLTFDADIQDAVVAHVNAMSTAENARWRVAWLSTPIVESTLLYDLQENGTAWKATVADDPLAAGTQYTLVTGTGTTFVTDGVRPGDKVLINFRLNSVGDQIHDTYTVQEVRTETSLVLASGPSAAISPAIKIQVQRIYTKDEQITTLAAKGAAFNNRRVRVVFPPVTKNGAIEKDGYYLAAALAGLRSGVVPHQGLTNTELLGFTDLSMSVIGFTETQLNTLAESGLFIVTQKTIGATPYVRHQLTTDSTNANTIEDSKTSNTDSIAYGLMRVFSPFIGVYNVHPRAVLMMRAACDLELRFRQINTYTTRAGNQLISYEILKFEQDATFKDRVIVQINLEEPSPLNFVQITLFI
jgi:hypothetical protein